LKSREDKEKTWEATGWPQGKEEILEI